MPADPDCERRQEVREIVEFEHAVEMAIRFLEERQNPRTFMLRTFLAAFKAAVVPIEPRKRKPRKRTGTNIVEFRRS
jgi:hypothetical protein